MKTDAKNTALRAKRAAARSAEVDKIAADFKANQRMVTTVVACDTRDFDPAHNDARPTHCSKCGYSYSDHMRVWAIAAL